MKVSITDVRGRKPLVHCITNYVTINDCANILLAAGASPIMAHHPMEVAEVAADCDALVCNLGAMDDFEAMKVAYETAVSKGTPIVVDPVGTAGIRFRRERFAELLKIGSPACIRGNSSEIRALLAGKQTAKGVDAGMDGGGNVLDIREAAAELSRRTGSIVVASGAIDYISDGSTVLEVYEGDSMLTRITGTGCMSTALIAAFLSCEVSAEAAAESCILMGSCGYRAAEQTRQEGAGTMTFRMKLIDQISLAGLS